MDELRFTLSSPITEEEWDMIEDVDFAHTESILFHTKHGKEVEFVKRKRGKWIVHMQRGNWSDKEYKTCSECRMTFVNLDVANFCPNCGAKMGGEQE